MNRKHYILAQLKTDSTSAFMLAYRLQCPEASVRRAIGSLREEGHDIRVMSNHRYRYFPPTDTLVSQQERG